jgi:hypothetical protein
LGFRVWGAGNNQTEMRTENLSICLLHKMADVITENFKISSHRFCGAIDKKTGHYKEGGGLVEIRFFHSQVHKGFRVWILDPSKTT